MNRTEKNDPERDGARRGPNDLEAAVEAFQTPLLRYAGRLLRNDDAAQDVVQEVFLRYFRSPPAERDPRRVSNWLYRVAHNLCIDHMRKETRMRESCRQMETPPPSPPPSDRVIAEQTRRRLDGLLGRLNENQRTVLLLSFEEGKSYREISEITGLTVSNIGSIIHRGLKKLAAMMREEELT